MKKEEVIRRYGEETYNKMLKQKNEWAKQNPEKIERYNNEQNRKGGKFYERELKYHTTGLPGERHKIRSKHGYKWRKFKRIIAPCSEIHHAWCEGSSKYSGVALVEKDAHRHGYIDVIKILEGEITLVAEENIRMK